MYLNNMETLSAYTWFQSSVTKYMRSAPYWAIMHLIVDFLTLAVGADKWCWNVCKELPLYTA